MSAQCADLRGVVRTALRGDTLSDAERDLALSSAFLEYAAHHRVSAAVYPGLQGLSPQTEAQSRALDELQARSRRQWVFTERLLTVYEELWAAMHERGLEDHVCFPGGALFAERFYPDPMAMWVRTIDLCLHTANLKERLFALMRMRGFTSWPDRVQALPGTGFTRAYVFRRNAFHVRVHLNPPGSDGPYAARSREWSRPFESKAGPSFPVLEADAEVRWRAGTLYRELLHGRGRLHAAADLLAPLERGSVELDAVLDASGGAPALGMTATMLALAAHALDDADRYGGLHERAALVGGVSRNATAAWSDAVFGGPASPGRRAQLWRCFPGGRAAALAWIGRGWILGAGSRGAEDPQMPSETPSPESALTTPAVARRPRAQRLARRVARRARTVLNHRLGEPPVARLFGRSWARVRVHVKVVALTFDDGPLPPYTADLLNVLDRHGVKATFFMLGRQVERFPATAQEVRARGHQIGSHGYSHTRMLWMPLRRIRSELDRTDALLRENGVTGDIPFRPPFGAQFLRLPWVLWRTRRRNIFFDFFPDPPDWSPAPAAASAADVVARARPGSILVLHDGEDAGHKVCAITDAVITGLRADGYAFLTVDELLRAEDR